MSFPAPGVVALVSFRVWAASDAPLTLPGIWGEWPRQPPVMMNQPSADPSSSNEGGGNGDCHGAHPEWVPEGCENDPRYAGRVLAGATPDPSTARRPAKRRKLTLDDYERGVLAGDLTVLSRAITLVESNHPAHEALAQQLLERILPRAGGSIRVGITGVPGAGKSTLISALGCKLCDEGHKVAILAVDPSSSITGGSILGDKTRMGDLVGRPEAFIRPSPSGGSLGGVARKSRETMLLCEAAGYDVLLVETVGVGQNEVTVRSMVDFFLLVLIAGAGDELQGMKKGVIEIADLLAINKADGDNVKRAQFACAESNRVLQFLQPATPGWKTRCVTCSAFQPETLDSLWNTVTGFADATRASGELEKRRRHQAIEWMHAMIAEELRHRFFRNPRVTTLLPDFEHQVATGTLPAAAAVKRLMEES